MSAADAALQRLRDLCLSLPETSEVGSWGHPNFRAGKRTFATFEWISGRPSIAFRLDTPDINLFLRRSEFFITPYGRGQWVSIWADAPLDWHFVGGLLRRSYRVVALKRMMSALEGDREVEGPAIKALQPTPPLAVPPARKKRLPRRG